jgi:hypothetical protein
LKQATRAHHEFAARQFHHALLHHMLDGRWLWQGRERWLLAATNVQDRQQQAGYDQNSGAPLHCRKDLLHLVLELAR